MLKKSLILSLLFYFLSSSLTAQSEISPLSISFSGMSSKQGKIMIRIQNSEGEIIRQLSLAADAQPLKIEVKLKPGAYAVAAFHDENSNDKIDKAFTGIPTEKYGFSNNVRGMIGPPDLEDQLVDLSKNNSITIRLE